MSARVLRQDDLQHYLILPDREDGNLPHVKGVGGGSIVRKYDLIYIIHIMSGNNMN